MEILGVGPSELIFIIVIALIVLGPKDMQKAGKSIGQFLNKMVRSDGWRIFQQTSRELRNLPNNLMREANLDMADAEREILKSINLPPLPGMSLPTNPNLPRPQTSENSIQPPSATNTPADDESPSVSDPAINTPDSDLSAPNQNA